MHETKPATRNRKRRSSSLRSEALRFFEQCERGLVAAYRALPPGLLSLRDSNRLAALHENHATLLADCLDRDGGRSAADPHDLWITEPTKDKIARMTLAGTVTEFPVMMKNSGIYDIEPGPDGNVWFTDFGGGKIGRLVP